MKIVEILKPEAIIPCLQAQDHQQVLFELAECMARAYPDWLSDSSEIARRLMEREIQGSTNLGEGLAIPHCRMPHLDRTLVVMGVSQTGVSLPSAEEEKLFLFVALVSPSHSVGEHLRVLARICRLFKGTELSKQLRTQSSVEDIYASIVQFESQL